MRFFTTSNTNIKMKLFWANSYIHTNSIQILHDLIILALLRSSEVIPETGTKSKNIPGWNDDIKHLKLTASFLRNLWRDNSSPLTGHIHDIMKETHRKYNYGIRNVKKQWRRYC